MSLVASAALMLPAVGIAAEAPGPGSPCAGSANPWCNTSLSPDERAQLVLAAMTQAEKFDFMAGEGLLGLGGHTGRNAGIPRLGVPEVDQTDASAGVRQGEATAMPAPIALAATFDQDLARRYGALVANEAKNRGNDILLGPGVNIMRIPGNGRNFEYFSEDPELAAEVAVAYIEGTQGEGVIADVKHYALNNQEGLPGPVGSRHLVNAIVDERTLREIYLPAFEAAVKDADVGTVMEAYNRVNGAYMTENCPLVVDVLKGDWDFAGFAISDYFVAQQSTVDSANCGNDLEEPSPVHYTPELLGAAVASGQVSQATIDDHVLRQLRTMFAFGLFDRAPFPEAGAIDFAGHGATARKVAGRAMTLLKNRGGRLPLDPGSVERIALIGEAADEYAVGAGSSQVDPIHAPVTPLDGIRSRAAAAGITVVYDDGTDPARAAQVAAAADVAIVVAATHEGEGAGGDRPCLSLAPACNPPPPIDLDGPGPLYGDQDAVIAAVGAAQKDTVVVLESGTPVLMPWLRRVKAVLEAWYPGQEGGDAIAAVLFGAVNPAGRLPVTFPKSEADTPFAGHPERYPGINDTATYSEGVFMGYRHYDQHRIKPLFAFGHGLSYTQFRFSDLRVQRAPGKRGGAFAKVSLAVTNTGDRRGVAVPQLYLGLPSRPGVRQPPKALKGFNPIELARDQARRVRFKLDRRAVSYWDAEAHEWRLASGCVRVLVGRSSRKTPLEGTLAVNSKSGQATCT